MNLTDQQNFLIEFHELCLSITSQKGPDYAPDGIPLLDMLASCVEADISIPQGLWVLFRKHFSAIRKHFFMRQPLVSEPIFGRLADAANYFAFLAFWETHKHVLIAAWSRHWMAHPCECYELDDETPKHHGMKCQRCETLRWLDRQELKDASVQTLSDLTRKAQD